MPDNERQSRPDEGMTRRSFLESASALVALVGAVAMGIPLVGTLFAARRSAGARFARIAIVEELPVGVPARFDFTEHTQDAFIQETLSHTVYALKRSGTDIVVYSPVCTHLGCQVAWDSASGRFICPCHNSVFDISGKVLAGPAPRGLDTLPAKIEDGALLVMWQQYRPGIPQKTLV
jgi:menaquinol-cytochrome c reductase iron-sulfur subunit